VNDTLPRLESGGTAEEIPAAAFVRLGEYWSLAYDGTNVLLRDAKGLHYLAELLRRAGEKVSVAVLAAEPATSAEPNATGQPERARSAVTKRIRDALQKIEKNHPVLGRHLSARVKTGYECSYTPDPDRPVVWRL
jgi:hypothetical protein